MASNVAKSSTSLCDRGCLRTPVQLDPDRSEAVPLWTTDRDHMSFLHACPAFSQSTCSAESLQRRSSHGLDTLVTTMETCLFRLPLELREKIYSELLVVAVPIVFDPWPTGGSPRRGPYTAILRVNKKAYREASRLFYSENRFEIPNYLGSPGFPGTAPVALFLSQIGSQANLIRHICIDFPRWDFEQPDGGIFDPADMRNLELIQASCQNIRVLELSLDTRENSILDESVSTEILDSIDVEIKDFPPRKETMVRIQVYGEDDIRDSVTRMCSFGWTVEVTKQEPVKETWEYDEHGIEFDNQDDYWDYVNMVEKEREEKEWLEDYWERRNDPWRKKNSDYD